RLRIIGWGALRHDLIYLVKKRQLEKFITFHDPVPNDKIAQFIAEADVGIVPKRGGIFSDNALSSKLLDFVSLGIPAVVSRTPVEQYYFDENMVMFFEPENPEDLARAVIDLYRNPERRKQLVRNANKFNNRHNWEHYKKIYYRVVDELCTNSTS
ncbi:MAG: glycosyltransferase, partial [Candidatus Hodarchaeota archaeon]